MLNFLAKRKTPKVVVDKDPAFAVSDVNKKWQETKLSPADMLRQYKSWSFICARLNAESVASSNIHLYAKSKRGQGKISNFDTRSLSSAEIKAITKQHPMTSQVEQVEEIFDHPALELIYTVNDFSNYFDNMQLTQTYLDLTGNAYWFITKDEMGVPSGIYQMRPDLTKVVGGKSNIIKGYIYGNKEKEIALRTDEVIRFNVPNPNNMWYGQSCIEAGSAEVSRNNLYNSYENSNLQNNARPDFAVKYDGQLTEKDMKTLTLKWNKLYQGAKNAHKIKIMDSNWNIEKLSFSPKDMEYLNGRNVTKKDLSAMFGVPHALLDTENQLKAGLDNVLSYYQRFSIKPRLRRVEEALNEQLIPLFDDSGDLFFHFDDPVDDDKKFIADTNVAYVKAGIITVNEARNRIGLNPITGMDQLVSES